MKHTTANKPLIFFIVAVIIVCLGVLYQNIRQKVSIDETGEADYRRAILSIQPNDYVYGDANAAVVIIEYADTECPFCKKLFFKLKDIVAKYKEKRISIAVVYRHAPLGKWDKSITEAHAAECVGAQMDEDGYYAFLDRLYEAAPSNNDFDTALLPALAVSAGADPTAFAVCMEKLLHLEKIKEQKVSSTALGVSTIPHLFIVGKEDIYEVVGNKPEDTITFLIDQALRNE